MAATLSITPRADSEPCQQKPALLLFRRANDRDVPSKTNSPACDLGTNASDEILSLPARANTDTADLRIPQ